MSAIADLLNAENAFAQDAHPALDPRDRGGRLQPLLKVEGLTKHFALKGGPFDRKRQVVRAVDGIDFTVAKGETLGIVGESGGGKSTTARLLMHLEKPD